MLLGEVLLPIVLACARAVPETSTLAKAAEAGSTSAAMSELVLPPGALLPEHLHEESAELIYVLGGPQRPFRQGQQVQE